MTQRNYLQHGSRHRPLGTDPIPGLTPGGGSGVIAETLLLDSKASAGVTSSVVLTSGTDYIITVQGTYSLWDSALEHGTPEADAMFPSTGSRTSTEVGLDVECSFAYHNLGTGFTLGHEPLLFEMDLGSGLTHIEPIDGSHSTPAPAHFYKYSVTGQGSVVHFLINDAGTYTSNYGKLQITIQTVAGGSGSGGGSGGSGGGGSLVPPPPSDATKFLNGAGAPAFAQVKDSDLATTDITTNNLSTSKHGFAPKAPNDTLKVLVGDGSFAYPTIDGGTA